MHKLRHVLIRELKQGVLQNGETIAVKKLKLSIPGVHDRQFENEASHLMRLKHPNVVLLVGWCSETQYIPMEYNGTYVCAEKPERLLCLEYMPKGSLLTSQRRCISHCRVQIYPLFQNTSLQVALHLGV